MELLIGFEVRVDERILQVHSTTFVFPETDLISDLIRSLSVIKAITHSNRETIDWSGCLNALGMGVGTEKRDDLGGGDPVLEGSADRVTGDDADGHV